MVSPPIVVEELVPDGDVLYSCFVRRLNEEVRVCVVGMLLAERIKPGRVSGLCASRSSGYRFTRRLAQMVAFGAFVCRIGTLGSKQKLVQFCPMTALGTLPQLGTQE